MRIAIGGDHAAFTTKASLIQWLHSLGHETEDYGTTSAQSVDYVDHVVPAARAVRDGRCEYGIVLCGSGLGASYAANKVHGIRAAFCADAYLAEMARRHNNANVMVFGARRQSLEEMQAYIQIWLSTPYEGGRHDARLAKLQSLEAEECALSVKPK